jgi:hypothetical protein
MNAMGFTEVFWEIFDVNSAVGITFFCGLGLFNMHRLDRDVMKARLFLNGGIIQETWLFISIAGLSLALNTLFKPVGRLSAIGNLINNYHLADLTYFVFLIAFIHVIYSWYLFIRVNPK